MKLYEAQGERRMMPLLPTFARVDGRAFHSFTRGMRRPYDQTVVDLMIDTAAFLARETNACMTYTQSDEITLCWLSNEPKSQIWFDGRHSKMVSQIAALATLEFYRLTLDRLPDYARKMPTFDARVWTVPNRAEAVNVFIWREKDATKNSISMAAQSLFSARELHGKNSSQKQEMLFQKGVNWNDYPAFFKRGTYIQRRILRKLFTTDEIESLPPKHAARSNPDLEIERTVFEVLALPPLLSVANREAVILDGAMPGGEKLRVESL